MNIPGGAWVRRLLSSIGDRRRPAPTSPATSQRPSVASTFTAVRSIEPRPLPQGSRRVGGPALDYGFEYTPLRPFSVATELAQWADLGRSGREFADGSSARGYWRVSRADDGPFTYLEYCARPYGRDSSSRTMFRVNISEGFVMGIDVLIIDYPRDPHRYGEIQDLFEKFKPPPGSPDLPLREAILQNWT